MRGYDPADDGYDGAIKLFQAARIPVRSHRKVARVGFYLIVAAAVVAAVVIGWPR